MDSFKKIRWKVLFSLCFAIFFFFQFAEVVAKEFILGNVSAGSAWLVAALFFLLYAAKTFECFLWHSRACEQREVARKMACLYKAAMTIIEEHNIEVDIKFVKIAENEYSCTVRYNDCMLDDEEGFIPMKEHDAGPLPAYDEKDVDSAIKDILKEDKE